VRGDETVVEGLNEVLTAELTAVNQYFLDARMFDHWGYQRLGARFRADSIDEMRDADRLILRLLYLEGHPNVQRLGAIQTGETAVEKLKLALDLEHEAIARLNRLVGVCVERSDNGSRELLEAILVGEEEHADWLDTQLEAIRQIGEANYLAQQLHD
jgi:bacterioferritin